MSLHAGNTIDGWGYKLPEMGKDYIIMKENWVLSYFKKPMDSVHYTLQFKLAIIYFIIFFIFY